MTNLAENLTATAQRFPDRPAIKLDDLVLTWSDVQQGAQRVAGMLRSKGVGPGDRVGMVLPPLGLIAVILYRVDKDEPERQCPNCHKPLKLYVQVCPRCGTDLYLPDPAAVRHPGVH